MNILVGVSASIAIYKACDLVRELTKAGHKVRVVMSRTAAEWISPVIFSALSDHKVYTEAMNRSDGMPHIEIRENLDLMVVAPATADIIAKAAAGMADEILLATLLSFPGPRYFAPAMNPFMFSHPATQKNLKTLESYGYHLLSPANGEAVCGDEGQGKMMTVGDILRSLPLR